MHAGNGQLHQIDKSRQLQRKLYLAAKKCRERRFHALYDRILRPDVLWRAWQEVKANRGSAGVDGVSLEEVERQGVAPFLEVIAADLKAGRYQPQPVLRVYIPKPDGRQRPLGIPTVRDRIVQQASQSSKRTSKTSRTGFDRGAVRRKQSAQSTKCCCEVGG